MFKKIYIILLFGISYLSCNTKPKTNIFFVRIESARHGSSLLLPDGELLSLPIELTLTDWRKLAEKYDKDTDYSTWFPLSHCRETNSATLCLTENVVLNMLHESYVDKAYVVKKFTNNNSVVVNLK